MKAKVILKHCDTYTRDILYQKMKEALQKMGGMNKYVSVGQKVLLKPNILLGEDPKQAITTHPDFLWAVIKLTQEAGGIVFVGDSAGFGTGKRAARASGIMEIIEETGATWFEFKTPKVIKGLENGIFQYFTVDRKIPEMDVIINIPKLKTHFMTYMTLAVKNLYGCLIGPQKRQWTIQANSNKRYFSKMLEELSEVLNPQLTIVDGITGMEGNGPTHGKPRPTNIIAIGDNCTAIDRVISEITCIKPGNITTLAAAKKINTGVWDLGNIDLFGKNIKDYKIDNFRPPDSLPFKKNFFTTMISSVLKNSLTIKPVINHSLCKDCQACYNNCPMSAIMLESNKEANLKKAQKTIDYNTCIRCLHCEEICPKGAITLKKGWLLNLYTKLCKLKVKCPCRK